MKFKVALSILRDPLPYRVHVAIPCEGGKFLVHEYKFSRSFDAVMMAMDYFNTFKKRPEDILDFHKEKLAEAEVNLTLPFFKR
jgi:hypothetical protein